MSEIKIEVGTFPTRDEGLPTMGLMIQTPNPVDMKKQILDDHKIVKALLSYHNHCNVMLRSLDDSPSDESFIEEQTKRWVENREQIEEMIKYATDEDIDAIHSMEKVEN